MNTNFWQGFEKRALKEEAKSLAKDVAYGAGGSAALAHGANWFQKARGKPDLARYDVKGSAKGGAVLGGLLGLLNLATR